MQTIQILCTLLWILTKIDDNFFLVLTIDDQQQTGL